MVIRIQTEWIVHKNKFLQVDQFSQNAFCPKSTGVRYLDIERVSRVQVLVIVVRPGLRYRRIFLLQAIAYLTVLAGRRFLTSYLAAGAPQSVIVFVRMAARIVIILKRMDYVLYNCNLCSMQ